MSNKIDMARAMATLRSLSQEEPVSNTQARVLCKLGWAECHVTRVYVPGGAPRKIRKFRITQAGVQALKAACVGDLKR